RVKRHEGLTVKPAEPIAPVKRLMLLLASHAITEGAIEKLLAKNALPRAEGKSEARAEKGGQGKKEGSGRGGGGGTRAATVGGGGGRGRGAAARVRRVRLRRGPGHRPLLRRGAPAGGRRGHRLPARAVGARLREPADVRGGEGGRRAEAPGGHQRPLADGRGG